MSGNPEQISSLATIRPKTTTYVVKLEMEEKKEKESR